MSIQVTVIDDHSDEQCINAIKNELRESNLPTSFIPLDGSGNAASLLYNFNHAKAHCTDLIYFVEDDHLHGPTAIAEMVDAYNNLKGRFQGEVAIFPCDCPDRYRDPYQSLILLSPARYWRTVLNTTATFLISHAVLQRFWGIYRAFADYGTNPSITEDSTINQIYRQVPCLSPMPALAMHLHDGLISPFTNWQEWWEAAGK